MSIGPALTPASRRCGWPAAGCRGGRGGPRSADRDRGDLFPQAAAQRGGATNLTRRSDARVRPATRPRGLGKPETFAFLGFTHICTRLRDGRFWVRRITISKRMRAKLRAVNDQLRRRRYQPIPEQGRWLASVVRGYRAYYAVPGNRAAVAAFRTQVTRHWHAALERRSQRTRISWKRMDRLATRWLPPARVVHPFPDARFRVRTQGRSPVR